MKKILFTLMLGLLMTQVSFAQDKQEDLSKGFQDLSIEMNKAMEQMQSILGNSQFLIDTLMVKGLEPLMGMQSPLSNMKTDSLDMNGMIDMMQEQMNQLSQQDWKELESLMNQFSQMMPLPDGSGISPKSNGDKPTKNKRGKKIRSM